MEINLQYKISEAVQTYLDADKKTIEDFSKETKISKVTLYQLFKKNTASPKVIENIYSFLYASKYRLNAVKEELLVETSTNKILFHGSKYGFNSVSASGSRENCDFGNGFYLGETYFQALSFVCENESSSVYSFSFKEEGLNILKFKCSLEWMLAICYYRKSLNKYKNADKIQKIIEKINKADLIIAPIADNKMFYVMSLFANGDINSNVAIHSLSASKLGLQYVFKTEKALKCLTPIEKYYLCKKEKEDCQFISNKRADEIETKLKLAKREFRGGLFIEELLK
ncbi:MAG: DUF3990 domain-containing protein [Bacilli bacterium]